MDEALTSNTAAAETDSLAGETLSSLLERELSPNARVIELGPGDSPLTDPSLLAASKIIEAGQGGGIAVVDPRQTASSGGANSQMGRGDISRHLDDLRRINPASEQFVGWAGPSVSISDVGHKISPDQRADVLIDHNTGAFLANRAYAGGDYITAETVAEQYDLALGPNGKAIIGIAVNDLPPKGSDYPTRLRQALEGRGFDVTELRDVDDTATIQLTPEQLASLRNQPISRPGYLTTSDDYLDVATGLLTIPSEQRCDTYLIARRSNSAPTI